MSGHDHTEAFLLFSLSCRPSEYTQLHTHTHLETGHRLTAGHWGTKCSSSCKICGGILPKHSGKHTCCPSGENCETLTKIWISSFNSKQIATTFILHSLKNRLKNRCFHHAKPLHSYPIQTSSNTIPFRIQVAYFADRNHQKDVYYSSVWLFFWGVMK